MPKPGDSIGLDLGHSAPKSSFFNPAGVKSKLLFKSVVTPAFAISDEVEARRAAEETVRVKGRSYFFGETAEVQGGGSVATGLSEDWVDTPEYAALLLGALKKLDAAGALAPAKMIVMGLPVKLHSRYKDRLRALAISCLPQDKEIKIIPQPMGAYHHALLDDFGMPIPGRSMSTESWGIAEVGYFSSDFMLMQNGRWVEKASDGCSGVRVAAEHLMRLVNEKKKLTCDLGECEAALQTRVIRNFGQKVDVTAEVNEAVSLLVAEIHDNATRLLEPFARKLDGVVVAGGGAPLALPQLKAKWPHSIMPQEHRFAVAEGMRRFGQAILRSREMAAQQ